MDLFRDDIHANVEDVNDEEDCHSDIRADEEYDPLLEKDLGDEDEAAENLMEIRLNNFEETAEHAPPIVNSVQEQVVVTQDCQRQEQSQCINACGGGDDIELGGSPLGKRKCRKSTTAFKKPNCPMVLEYNAKGQPTGQWRHNYTTHLGICARRINILLKTKDIPKGLIQTFWDDTKNLFHIEDSQWRRAVFESALKKRFTDWVSQLRTRYITCTYKRTSDKKTKGGDEGADKDKRKQQKPLSHPCVIWPQITKDDWATFVVQNSQPKVLEKSEKARLSSKQNKHNHVMGPRTYEECRDKWIAAGLYPSITAGSSADSSTSTVSELKLRAYDWWESKHKIDKNTGKYFIEDQETKKTADALMKYTNDMVEGKITPTPDHDPFTLAFEKPYHPGRVVGAGGTRLGLEAVMGSDYTRSRSRKSQPSVNTPQCTDSTKEAIKEELRQEMQEQFNAILKHLNLPPMPLPMHTPGDSCSRPGEQNNKEQVDKEEIEGAGNEDSLDVDEVLQTPTPIADVEEETACRLYHPRHLSSPAQLDLVAYGSIQPPHDVIHCRRRSSTHVSVGIDSILVGFEELPLPIPNEEAEILVLNQARGSFVQWPRHWVRLMEQELKESQCSTKMKAGKPKTKGAKPLSKTTDQGSKNHSSQSRASKVIAAPLIDDFLHNSLSKECAFLHLTVGDLPTDHIIHVPLPKAMFHFDEDVTTPLVREDIKEFLEGEMLNISIVQVFMRSLNDQMSSNSKSPAKVGWLCPEQIADTKILGNPAEVKEYTQRGITESCRSEDKFIFAPCFEDSHWSLLVICVSNNTIYQFDSARVSGSRKLLFKNILKNVMKKINFRAPEGPKWISPMCAQQDNGVDCALYVCRFMYDINNTYEEVKDLDEVCKKLQREGPFTTTEINDIRNMWASYVTFDCM